LGGTRPFDEETMLDDVEPPPLAEHPVGRMPPSPAPVPAQPTTA
jgi:hypothetical protein